MVETVVKDAECGISVQWGAAKLEMYNCEITDCGMCCANVSNGAQVVLDGCKMSRTKLFHGVAVDGKGSKISVRDCVIEDAKLQAIAVSSEAHAVVENCILKNSEAASIVNIVNKATAILKGCKMTGSKTSNGVECLHDSTAEVHGCVMSGNKDAGAGAFIGGTMILTDCKAEDNDCGFWAQENSSMTLTDCRCINNTVGCGGVGQDTKLVMSKVHVESNDPEAHGAQVVRNAEATMSDCTFEKVGVKVSTAASLKLSNCTVCKAAQGAGLHVSAASTSAEAEGCTFTENEDVGAAAFDGGSLKLVECTALNNGRGGFYVQDQATMEVIECRAVGSETGMGASGEGTELKVTGGRVEMCRTVGMHLQMGATATVNGLYASGNSMYSYGCIGHGSIMTLTRCVSIDDVPYHEADGGRIKRRGCRPSARGTPLARIRYFKSLD
ncbi:MAG: right-handed parallel beta-helix repeat-containing protein [Akkermansiaceae bacterium]|nr:right-handed parallel beta-helix repeat-containing protein [Akkermansiaceae bacterium]